MLHCLAVGGCVSSGTLLLAMHPACTPARNDGHAVQSTKKGERTKKKGRKVTRGGGVAPAARPAVQFDRKTPSRPVAA